MRKQELETKEGPDLEVPAEEAERAQPPALEAKVEQLEQQIKKLADERDQLQDQLLRTMADFQNARKRAQQEAQNIRQFATERLVRELLPVLDNFERTIETMDAGADVSAVAEGIRAVDRQFRQILESVDVSRISAKGQTFDPELHEAIALEATTEHPEDTVIHEVEAGYRMADKVIRPARVRVAKKP